MYQGANRREFQGKSAANSQNSSPCTTGSFLRHCSFYQQGASSPGYVVPIAAVVSIGALIGVGMYAFLDQFFYAKSPDEPVLTEQHDVVRPESPDTGAEPGMTIADERSSADRPFDNGVSQSASRYTAQGNIDGGSDMHLLQEVQIDATSSDQGVGNTSSIYEDDMPTDYRQHDQSDDEYIGLPVSGPIVSGEPVFQAPSGYDQFGNPVEDLAANSTLNSVDSFDPYDPNSESFVDEDTTLLSDESYLPDPYTQTGYDNGRYAQENMIQQDPYAQHYAQNLNTPNPYSQNPDFHDPNYQLHSDPHNYDTGHQGPTNYNANTYDPNSYDPSNYDPNNYDPNNYDPNNYDPNNYDPNNYDPDGTNQVNHGVATDSQGIYQDPSVQQASGQYLNDPNYSNDPDVLTEQTLYENESEIVDSGEPLYTNSGNYQDQTNGSDSTQMAMVVPIEKPIALVPTLPLPAPEYIPAVLPTHYQPPRAVSVEASSQSITFARVRAVKEIRLTIVGDQRSFLVEPDVMQSPGAVTLSTSATGGDLLDGQYRFKITASPLNFNYALLRDVKSHKGEAKVELKRKLLHELKQKTHIERGTFTVVNGFIQQMSG